MSAALGIGIITYKRPDLASLSVERVHQMTRSPFQLVVADDGSPGNIVALLRERARVVTGGNRGVAGNKNRALFHLAEIERCETILLLEDDTYPTAFGWEEPWLEACRRWGHVSFVGSWRHHAFRGNGSAADPYHSDYISGQCSGFSREAVACVGYLDPRFKGFGWEHVEHTSRMVRSGYGGYVADGRIIGLQIESALHMDKPTSFSNNEQLIANERLYKQIRSEPVYRSPWRDDAGMMEFRREQKSAGAIGSGWSAERLITLESDVPLLSLDKAATQSSVSSWTPGRSPEADAVHAVNGRIIGGKQFHTDHEVRPWWMLDLGEPFEIREIRIFNAMGEDAARSNRLCIETSETGSDWSLVYQRSEPFPFGGSDGRPLRWFPTSTLRARFVRLSISPEEGITALHLDQIAVYGVPLSTCPL